MCKKDYQGLWGLEMREGNKRGEKGGKEERRLYVPYEAGINTAFSTL